MGIKQYKILVVDDNSDWRKTLGGLLREAGYKVDVADSIEGALGLLTSRHFDVALLDVRLDETDESNTDGLILASTIKNQWPEVKIIIITGYETPDTLKQAMEPQSVEKERLASDFITKTDIKSLIYSIQELLGQ